MYSTIRNITDHELGTQSFEGAATLARADERADRVAAADQFLRDPRADEPTRTRDVNQSPAGPSAVHPMSTARPFTIASGPSIMTSSSRVRSIRFCDGAPCVTE